MLKRVFFLKAEMNKLNDWSTLLCRLRMWKIQLKIISILQFNYLFEPLGITSVEVVNMIVPKSSLLSIGGNKLQSSSMLSEFDTGWYDSISSNILSDMCWRTTRFTAIALSANADNSRALLFLRFHKYKLLMKFVVKIGLKTQLWYYFILFQ